MTLTQKLATKTFVFMAVTEVDLRGLEL